MRRRRLRIRRPRRRRSSEYQSRLTPPTQEELDALPADRRLELIDLQRQERHRSFNNLILAAGALGTVGTLLATAWTLRDGRDQLDLARQQQVTGSYSQAVEQLGSGKREVRTAAIYALERVAKDSPRDRQAIRDVLAAFIREHDPAPQVKNSALPAEPDTDVTAALTVLARRPADPGSTPALDLHGVRTRGIVLADNPNLANAILTSADLSNAKLNGLNLAGAELLGSSWAHSNLGGANLAGARFGGSDLELTYLNYSDLSHADLNGAKLTGAGLGEANLTGAHLIGANLTGGAYLTRSNLTGADLSSALLHGAGLFEANLTGANLSQADLSSADLRGAKLTGTDLTGANLSGADLRDTGETKAGLTKQGATFSSDTKFGHR